MQQVLVVLDEVAQKVSNFDVVIFELRLFSLGQKSVRKFVPRLARRQIVDFVHLFGPEFRSERLSQTRVDVEALFVSAQTERNLILGIFEHGKVVPAEVEKAQGFIFVESLANLEHRLGAHLVPADIQLHKSRTGTDNLAQVF